MSLFDDIDKTEMQEELAEAMEAMTSQLGPLMANVMKAILTIFDDEELSNRMVWLQASQAGKMRDALEKNGFTRDEAVGIISHQGSIVASALSSINNLNK